MGRTNETQHLGILGPLIRAAPGDVINVTLINRLSFPINMDPDGLVPLPTDANNATYLTGPIAQPNATVTYLWEVPLAAAPNDLEPDTKLWVYHSSVSSDASDNAGLVGPILISRQGAPAQPPSGRDIITFMQIFDEEASALYDANSMGRTATDVGLANDTMLSNSLLKHSINGYLFCNTPGIEMTQGEE